MVDIKEVEEVISKSFLPPPKHIYISEKPVQVERGEERFWIMGAQKRGQDMIILTPYSTVENIIHECLPPYEGVFTDAGVVPICEIKEGDRVLGHDGYFHIVEKVISHRYKGPMLRISTSHISIPLELTPNHPVFVRETGPFGQRYTWKKASELKVGDEIAITKFRWEYNRKLKISEITGRHSDGEYVLKGTWKNSHKIKDNIPITHELMELTGFYVADGGISGGSVHITLGKSEEEKASRLKELFKSVFGLEASIRRYERCIRVTCNSRVLVDFFKQFGGSRNRTLPFWVMSADRDLQLSFLKGYLQGDGHVGYKSCWGKNYGYFFVSTVSKNLAFQLYQILLRLGALPSLSTTINRGFKKNIIYRIDCKGRAERELLRRMGLFNGDEETRIDRKYGYYSGGHLWVKITDIQSYSYDGIVYNLEVRGAHSYLAELRAVHNCAHNLGFGELGAQIIGKLGALRQKLLPCIFRRKVKYTLVEEDAAEKLGFKEAGGHYILREKTRTAYQVKHFVLEGVE